MPIYTKVFLASVNGGRAIVNYRKGEIIFFSQAALRMRVFISKRAR